MGSFQRCCVDVDGCEMGCCERVNKAKALEEVRYYVNLMTMQTREHEVNVPDPNEWTDCKRSRDAIGWIRRVLMMLLILLI